MMRRDYLAKAKATLADDLWVDAGSVLRQHTDTWITARTITGRRRRRLCISELGRCAKLPMRNTIDHYEIRTVTDAFEGTIQSSLESIR